MARKPVRDSSVSYRLEEPVDVPYKVVGTPQWLEAMVPGTFPRRQILTVSKLAHLTALQDEIWKTKILTADTETAGPREGDGLDPVSPSSHLVCGQIGSRNMMYVFEPRLYAQMKPVLQSPDHLKILQNGVHDYRFTLSKYHIHIVRMFCTMLAEQVLTAGLVGRGVGLADLVRKYYPYRIISKNTRDDLVHFSGTFTEDMLFYAARDVYLLFDVYKAQKELLARLNLQQIAMREFQIIPATAEMGLTGVNLDADRLLQTIAYFERKQAQVEKVIFDIYNDSLRALSRQKQGLLGDEYETFNLKSPAAKRDALSRIGLHLESTEYDVLIGLNHPIGKPLADWSGYTKILDNYGHSLIERMHWHTKRIHPNFDQLGAGEHASRSGKDKKETIATGRYSSDFQQLPRPEHLVESIDGDELVMVESHFAGRLAQLRNRA